MTRSAAQFALAAVLVTFAGPAIAEERAERLVAPSQAVAEAWAREAREARRVEALRPSSKGVKVLFGSYATLQGLDMYSTIVARNSGAREVNPLMNTGYANAATFKAVMTATTLIGVKKLEKKNKKAAIVTMVTMNVVSAAVVATNFRNARRLQ